VSIYTYFGLETLQGIEILANIILGILVKSKLGYVQDRLNPRYIMINKINPITTPSFVSC